MPKLREWIDNGRLARNGKRVFLDTAKVGGEICVSKEAFQRFCDALSDGSDDEEVRRMLEEDSGE